MQLNHAQRELTLKIVYYGPGLSGKTTNLRQLYARTRPEVRGRLLSVETRDDRTLFFDVLPVFFASTSGYNVKVKLLTVPGQVIHVATRRIVLRAADAVAFVADSRRSATGENNRYWHSLREDMRENGLDPDRVPVVIQFNKKDLPDTRTEEELELVRRRGREPVVGAVALRGEGVCETFHELMRAAWQRLDVDANLGRNIGQTEEEFLGRIFSHLDLGGTTLQGRYGAEGISGGGAA
ncbi:GTPase domain-containing protein [Hyalangium sp.]|uniref:GTP-binding protein n=1 Tax=Hyalangium sp. TaxID=2028555 RepID=UPI002D48A522|nr:GTPase domain-containing protein [Hyalangium sp.]HYI02039.1 GTPase domain-containing protein [Hyalangium sp.]